MTNPCNCGWTQKQLEQDRPWASAETLEHLYHCEKMSQPDIGGFLGCDPALITRQMDELGVEARSIGEANALASISDPVPMRIGNKGYREWFHTYQGETKRVRVSRLAAVAWFGFDAVAGRVVHHQNHFKIDNRENNLRPMGQRAHARLHGDGLSDIEKIRVAELYRNGDTSQRTLGRMFDVSHKSIRRALEEL